jgi:KDO2-lipid IV(A) lauroyltransferase
MMKQQALSSSGRQVFEIGQVRASLLGKFLYYAVPIRRRTVLANMQRVFGANQSPEQINELAQSFYDHFARSFLDVMRSAFKSPAKLKDVVRPENKEAILRASEANRGVLVLAGHLGNWEVASVGGIENFPEYRGRFHVIRRSINPAWLDRIVTSRFRRVGLQVVPKKRSLDHILERLAVNDAVVFIMDQHAGGRDGVLVDFFGQPAWTFRSLAVVALSTRAPVVPLAAWREPAGTHVLRFEEPIWPVESDDTDEAIRLNTRLYNAALEKMILRHPEQWIWMHRRWKDQS